jgi:uncharacterized membrane protein HdeD (DUF308 family)
MDWMKILSLVAGVMMLFFLWPAYKHWSQNSPKAQKGDWAAVIGVFGAVLALILLLIAAVR